MTNQLSSLRKQIDELDCQIIALLEQRMQIAQEIGGLKSKLNHSIYNSQREQEILENLSLKSSLSYQQINQIYQPIFELTKKLQEEK